MKSAFLALGVWAAWLVAVTVAHHHIEAAEEAASHPVAAAPATGGTTNVATAGASAAATGARYDLAFLPVTCHLTCPVTDYITETTGAEAPFRPQKFSAWPELKEAFLASRTPAAFVLAPMAIALREQGVPIKVVYLGHRDGTAMMVNKDSAIHTIPDLRGKTVAVPSRFSNQYLLLFHALRQHGMTLDDVELVELPPPDMPAALQTGEVDAVTSGEPFMGRTEMDGYGRILYLTKDVWPGFISCVLAVREELIRDDPAAVQTLVTGIARSGKWLEAGMDNRMAASEFVGKQYYNQNPELLKFVLSKPPDRVLYGDLSLRRKDFEDIQELGNALGLLKGTVKFEDYADSRFSQAAMDAVAWEYEAEPATAEAAP